MTPLPSKRNTEQDREAADLKLNVSRLKAAMKQRGINGARLAELTGLTPSAISYFNSGKRQPSRSVLSEFADKLSVTVDYLLGVTDRPALEELLKNPRIAHLVERYIELTCEEQDKVLEIIRVMKGPPKSVTVRELDGGPNQP